MTPDEELLHVSALDDKYLLGGVILSEWTSFLIRDADTAFCSGANLAAILACQAAIECHLRYEYGDPSSNARLGFYDLIEKAPLDQAMKRELHELRRFRNRWVHVNDPHDDTDLLERPEANDAQLEQMAFCSIDLLRKVVYLEQWI